MIAGKVIQEGAVSEIDPQKMSSLSDLMTAAHEGGARKERAQIVEWMRSTARTHPRIRKAFADAIERGEHKRGIELGEKR